MNDRGDDIKGEEGSTLRCSTAREGGAGRTGSGVRERNDARENDERSPVVSCYGQPYVQRARNRLPAGYTETVMVAVRPRRAVAFTASGSERRPERRIPAQSSQRLVQK